MTALRVVELVNAGGFYRFFLLEEAAMTLM
jgi:hypothetical protein